MVVSDLLVSELIEVNHTVIGGGYSTTSAQTSASSESSSGVAFGIAIGEQVFTNTRTLSSVHKSNFSSITFAFADAEAGANSNNDSAFSSSTSLSSNFTSNW